MDNQTRSWLVGVPFSTDDTPVMPDRPALSPGQKRELASFTGLVMASTVFFLTPLLLPSSEDALQGAGAPLAQASVATPAPMDAPAPVLTAIRSAARPAERTRSRPVALRGAPLAPVRTIGPGTAKVSHTVIVAAKESSRERRKGVASGLLRALVGSGRHWVQPFPTPSSGD